MIRAALAVLFAVLLIACSDEPEHAAQPTGAASPPTTPVIKPPSPRPAGNAAATQPAGLEPELPRADPFELARRYRGLDLTPQALTQPPPARTGESRTFFVYDLAATRTNEVKATLLAQTAHADVWAQDGQRFSRTDAERAGQVFESEVYPQVTAAFGLPAPAPDGSPGRIAILHTALRGAGGYFSGSDQLPRALAPFSNEQQMVYLDSGIARPGEAGYAGLLAHEFQHLVHQQRNPEADTWINEGLSEVANEMLGGSNSNLRRFETSPETQLNNWPAEGSSAPHYGAAHSFLRYLLRRYGGLDRAKDLSALGGSGVNSVERYLREEFGTGFFETFADWTVATLLDEDGDGARSQPGINHRTRSVERLPATGSGEGTVGQFGTRYLEITPDGRDVTLRFDGSESIGRAGIAPAGGRAFWWSNRSDSLDATLTREVDLTAVSRATLRYKLWFDIEQDFDFAYVSVSRDGGRTWQALRGMHASDRDPLRIALGPGYSGRSGADWVDEEVDLSAFAGSRILLRFEYVTDEASVQEGLALDDLSIAEIGWRDDAESDGGWRADGFLRVSGPLPQRLIVQVVEQDGSGAATVRAIALDAANDARITIPAAVRKATLIVSGATLGTTSPAGYRWQITR